MQTIIGKNYPKMVIPLIDKAVNSIKIVVFDWRWYSEDPGNPCQLFNASIIRARKRGVNIQVCVNSQAIAKPLTENDIDDKILVMGSHNFSQAAFTTNYETSIINNDPVQIQEFVLFFWSIWSL